MTEGKLKQQVFLWLSGFLMIAANLFLFEKGFSGRYNLPFNAYYTAVAASFLLLNAVLYVNFKNLVTYVFLCLSVNNFLDELFFNPQKLQLNEVISFIAIVIIWIVKKRIDARKITK